MTKFSNRAKLVKFTQSELRIKRKRGNHLKTIRDLNFIINLDILT